MEFVNKDKTLTLDEVKAVEAALHLHFPEALRELFVANNGGKPMPYVLSTDTIDSVVNETLPLISERERMTAPDLHHKLVADMKMIERRFFPFAGDGGGDYYFVDCDDPQGGVYISMHDSAKGFRLERVWNSISGFWDQLVAEF